jgi:hypothetical protein
MGQNRNTQKCSKNIRKNVEWTEHKKKLSEKEFFNMIKHYLLGTITYLSSVGIM